MSSFFKKIIELSLPTRIILLILVLLIILNIIVFKLSIKRWQFFVQNSQTLNKKSTQSLQQKNYIKQTQWKHVILYLLKAYTFIQHFITNMSINKIHKITLTLLWIYMLVCTQIFIPITIKQIYVYQRTKQIGLFNVNYIKILQFLSWNGLVIVLIDTFIRYIGFRDIILDNQQQRMKKDLTQSFQTIIHEKSIRDQVNNIRIPKKIIVYYSISILVNMSLILFIISHLVNSKSFKVYKPIQLMSNDIDTINFYSQGQSILKLTRMSIFLIILQLFHQILLALSGFLVYAILYMLECKINNIDIWKKCFGFQQQPNNRKVAHLNEQSIQNLGYLTQRTKIQTFFIVQKLKDKYLKPIQRKKLKKPLQSLQNNQEKSNNFKLYQRNKQQKYKKQQNMTSYCIKDIAGVNFNQKQKREQDFKKQINDLSQKNNKQIDNKLYFANQQRYNNKNSEVLDKKKDISFQIQVKEKQKISKKGKKKNIIRFFEQDTKKDSKCIENNEKQGQKINKNPTQLIIKKELQQQEFATSQPVLRNIQNKILTTSKSRKQKKELKVINFGQNEQVIDFIDLCQYVVSDLGCAKTTTSACTKPIIFSCKKQDKRKSSFNKSIQSQGRKHSSYKRRNNQRSNPTFPQLNIEPPTFCLFDIN